MEFPIRHCAEGEAPRAGLRPEGLQQEARALLLPSVSRRDPLWQGCACIADILPQNTSRPRSTAGPLLQLPEPPPSHCPLTPLRLAQHV